MIGLITTLLFAAPEWVRTAITRERQPNVFWSEYVVWPLIQILIVLFIVLTVVAYLVWVERKVSAFMQARLGPMRVGPWGLLQPLADGLKLLLKEDIIPLKADQGVFTVAPIISVVAALTVLAVIPWGAAWATISNINIGVLFVLAVSSISVLGLVLAGWSSNSKYSLLGALRSSAQMVSYEIGMGLSIIGALMFARTLSLNGIIEAQQADGVWYVLFQPVGFLVYLVSALGETNRAPFDLPEAESELVAGYHTEYSGFRWALFFMAEYTSVIVTSAIAVTLFLGGWTLFGLESRITPMAFSIVVAVLFVLLALLIAWRGVVGEPPSVMRTVGIVAVAIFLLLAAGVAFARPFDAQSARVLFSVGVFAGKILALIYAYMWFRWTWPRYRYDQLMALGWKWMIPAGLANIVLTGIWYVLALPRPQGVFGLMREQAGRLAPTGAGLAYFIGTAFVLTIPLSWALLATINRRTRDFNLAEQRQLQMRLRRERLEKQLQKGSQETEQA
ncbi:MAG TPA: NADH-quinone oxidoreductase subunit NuoH [Blastocatellia bacterium]|nr:NADH-quinone oxidoreductase subunit NuoH [Blastocatellia bacterium]